jgi:hypothetical protein
MAEGAADACTLDRRAVEATRSPGRRSSRCQSVANERAESFSRTSRRKCAKSRDRDVKLAESEGLLLRESREPTTPEGVETVGLLLGNEADEVERFQEIERAKLARRRLGYEEVLPLDRASVDRARVALGRQSYSVPGPESKGLPEIIFAVRVLQCCRLTRSVWRSRLAM